MPLLRFSSLVGGVARLDPQFEARIDKGIRCSESPAVLRVCVGLVFREEIRRNAAELITKVAGEANSTYICIDARGNTQCKGNNDLESNS